MYVRCTHCGYDNSPEYRFCGMCGASLAHPPVAVTTPAKEAARVPKQDNGQVEPVHGPSFLGLADDAADPKVEFHYLYEDEQPKSHVGLIVFRSLPWARPVLPAGNGSTTDSRLTAWAWANSRHRLRRRKWRPASNPDQQTHIDKPMTGAGEVLPTQPDQNAQNQTPGKPTETDIPPANGAAQQNAGSQPAATQPPNTTAQSAGTPAPGDNSTANERCGLEAECRREHHRRGERDAATGRG